MPVQTKLQLRRSVSGPAGTTGTWANVNPVLASGEAGVETDTGKFKIGDGTTAWNSLVYAPSGLADRATNVVGGAAGSLPYQTALDTTTTLAIGGAGTTLVVNSGGTAPTWVKPTITTTYFSSTTSAELKSVLTDETGNGVAVFNDSPSLVTPTVGSAGANFTGSTSGTTVLKASATAGAGTIQLPAEAGTKTLLTQETAASTYIPLAGTASISGALTSNSNITTSATVEAATLKSTTLTTVSAVTSKGVLQNDSSGVITEVAALPIGNGGTGGTTTTTAREGLRIFVQSGAPATPALNDLWFW